MPISKQFTKEISDTQLELLLQNFVKNLPDNFIINQQEYTKSALLIAKNILRLKVSETHVLILLAFVTFQDVSGLISELSEEEFKGLVNTLPKNSQIFYDLLSYNLIDTDTRLAQRSSSCLRQTPLKPFVPITHADKVAILQKHAGLLYFQHHLDLFSWQFIIASIQTLAMGEIQSFYIELPHEILAPLFDIFNQTGDVYLLRKHLDATPLMFPQLNPYFVALSDACYKKKIKVIPVDKICELDRIGVNEQAIQERNNYMVNIIKQDSATKFMGLFGLLHYGISNSLHIPSFGIMPCAGAEKISPKKLFIEDECLDLKFLFTQFSKTILSPARPIYSCRYFTMGVAVAVASLGMGALALSMSKS